MEIVRDILLILAFAGISLFGYFVMSKFDKFLDGNRKSIEKDSEKRGPSCVMLTDELSKEEIAKEVENFKKGISASASCSMTTRMRICLKKQIVITNKNDGNSYRLVI